MVRNAWLQCGFKRRGYKCDKSCNRRSQKGWCGMRCEYLQTSKLVNRDYETTLYRCKNNKSNRFGKSSFDRCMICNNCLLHQKKRGAK